MSRGKAMTPSRKRHQDQERRFFSQQRQPAASDAGGALDIRQWREESRHQALVDFARRTRGLKWSKQLFLLLLEELYIGDEFDEIIGRPEKFASSRYPQAIAFAIALRHSWRPDDLAAITRALSGRASKHRPRRTKAPRARR